MGGGARVSHGFASRRLCSVEELRYKEIDECICIDWLTFVFSNIVQIQSQTLCTGFTISKNERIFLNFNFWLIFKLGYIS